MSRIHAVSYSQLPGITSKVVLAPLIPATLSYNGNDFSGFALVDSGASGGVISTVIAEELGIKWRNIPVSQGFSVGGIFRSHKAEKIKAEIFDYVFQLSVSIVEGISPYRFILGQADLFHQAKISFEEYNKQFTLEFRKLN